jgi:hypothetical protein
MPIDGNGNVNALKLTVGTGGDDLRDGTPLSLFVFLRNGDYDSKEVEHQGWSGNTTHEFIVSLAKAPKFNDLDRLGFHFEGGGGVFGDNWNMNEFDVDVLIDESTWYQAIQRYQDPYIFRFTGIDKDWTTPFTYQASSNQILFAKGKVDIKTVKGRHVAAG